MGENCDNKSAEGLSDPAYPPFLWRTLIGRSLFEYDAALLGDNAGALLNEAYFMGVAEEQKRITRSLNLLFWASLVLAWALIAKTIDWSSLKITVLGISIPAGLVSKQVLYFTLAMLFSQCMLKVISLVLVTQIMQKAARFHFQGAWKIYLARYEADSLWADLLQPRLVGYTSPFIHHVLTIFSFLIVISVSLGQLILVNIASVKVFNELWNSATTTLEQIVALLSLTMITSVSLIFFISVCVPLKFRFKESH